MELLLLLSPFVLVSTRLFGGCVVGYDNSVDRQVYPSDVIVFSLSLYVCLFVWEMLSRQSTDLACFLFFLFIYSTLLCWIHWLLIGMSGLSLFLFFN